MSSVSPAMKLGSVFSGVAAATCSGVSARSRMTFEIDNPVSLAPARSPSPCPLSWPRWALWRVYECVCRVLALESETSDPRLQSEPGTRGSSISQRGP
jgi:hypothetical protein